MLLASIELETFSPLYGVGQKRESGRDYSPLIVRCLHKALRRALSACGCLIWSGEEGIMDSILSIVPSLWFVTELGCHQFVSTVIGQF